MLSCPRDLLRDLTKCCARPPWPCTTWFSSSPYSWHVAHVHLHTSCFLIRIGCAILRLLVAECTAAIKRRGAGLNQPQHRAGWTANVTPPQSRAALRCSRGQQTRAEETIRRLINPPFAKYVPAWQPSLFCAGVQPVELYRRLTAGQLLLWRWASLAGTRDRLAGCIGWFSAPSRRLTAGICDCLFAGLD